MHALFKTIPADIRIKKEVDIPFALDEISIKHFFQKNIDNHYRVQFVGCGMFKHFVPEVVTQIIGRGEWLTAYTPYQAEVSQGTLQSIFEFQTIVSNMYGCEIANASLYDGATATIEAILMTIRMTNKKCVIIPTNIHPEYLDVCKAYAKMCNFKILTVPFDIDSGNVDTHAIENLLKNGNISSLLYQYPNFLGGLEDQQKLNTLAHTYGALSICINPEPLVFGSLKPPGLYNADIVVGEGIGLCPFTGLGSPGLGLFATKKKFLRFIPGRLVSMTKDQNNKRSFVLTLSTREQHIRRDRATSNICTNNALNALAFLITVSLYGKKGYAHVSKQNILKNIYFRKLIKGSHNVRLKYKNKFFNESVLEFENRSKLIHFIASMNEKGINIGLDLYNFFAKLDRHLLICITELNSIDDINEIIKDINHYV